jgi:hypothetical protein
MKALMVIDNHTISPFDIKSIDGDGGHRRRWCSYSTAKKLWHPMIETYIKRLPWWKRRPVHRRFPQAYYYHQPYVNVRREGHWHDIRIECRNVRERDALVYQLRSDWDQALANFHGKGCNFNPQDK